jgi:predicted MFS family arabinose efflux permease
MGAGIAALALVPGPFTLTLLGVVAGIVMAPALIIQSMLVARTAPAHFATEAFTWSTSCLLTGVGLGLALGGWVLESARSSTVFVAGGLASLTAAALAYLLLRRS